MKSLFIGLALTLSAQSFACDQNQLAAEEKVLAQVEQAYAQNTVSSVVHAAARSKYFDVAACERAYSWRMSCEGLISIHEKKMSEARAARVSAKELADASSMLSAIRNYCL